MPRQNLCLLAQTVVRPLHCRAYCKRHNATTQTLDPCPQRPASPADSRFRPRRSEAHTPMPLHRRPFSQHTSPRRSTYTQHVHTNFNHPLLKHTSSREENSSRPLRRTWAILRSSSSKGMACSWSAGAGCHANGRMMESGCARSCSYTAAQSWVAGWCDVV